MTTLSVRRLAAELTAAGHRVSQETVSWLLRAEGFSLQANAKTVEGGQHPDRDGQFSDLNDQAAGHLDAGEPGRAAYPGASRLLITADGGSSNGYRTRAWKTELAALDAETWLVITVCHRRALPRSITRTPGA